MLWREGPEWLREKQLYDTNSELSMPEDCIAEMKAKAKNLVHGLLTTKEPLGMGRVINCEDFSTLDRLLRVTARVLKFCSILQHKPRPEADDTARAEMLWIIESRHFYWEKGTLIFGRNNSGCSSTSKESGGVEGGLRMPTSPIQLSTPFFATRIIH